MLVAAWWDWMRGLVHPKSTSRGASHVRLTLVAVCMAGAARTIVHPVVIHSHRHHLLKPLMDADLFAVVNLGKDTTHSGLTTRPESELTRRGTERWRVHAALTLLGARVILFQEDQPAPRLSRCEGTSGGWTAASMFWNIQLCGEEVRKYEVARGENYGFTHGSSARGQTPPSRCRCVRRRSWRCRHTAASTAVTTMPSSSQAHRRRPGSLRCTAWHMTVPLGGQLHALARPSRECAVRPPEPYHQRLELAGLYHAARRVAPPSEGPGLPRQAQHFRAELFPRALLQQQRALPHGRVVISHAKRLFPDARI